MKERQKTVLCYGDSNTYGYIPLTGMRYPKSVRWPGALQDILGSGYSIIEEGCNGRTTIYDDPIDGWKNGVDYLRPCLHSHRPVDIFVMMLGSNDLKETFHASAADIAAGAETLLDVVQTFTAKKQGFIPEIILISPPQIGEGIAHSAFYGEFLENAIARSKEFPEYYAKVAQRRGCLFLDAAKFIQPSNEDSLHLTPEGHKILAREVSKLIHRKN